MKRKSKGNALEGWRTNWGRANAYGEYTALLNKLEGNNDLSRGEWYRYYHLQRQLTTRR